VPRAGIRARLDKDTTGFDVVAKDAGSAGRSWSKSVQERTVTREYEMRVVGVMTAGARRPGHLPARDQSAEKNGGDGRGKQGGPATIG